MAMTTVSLYAGNAVMVTSGSSSILVTVRVSNEVIQVACLLRVGHDAFHEQPRLVRFQPHILARAPENAVHVVSVEQKHIPQIDAVERLRQNDFRDLVVPIVPHFCRGVEQDGIPADNEFFPSVFRLPCLRPEFHGAEFPLPFGYHVRLLHCFLLPASACRRPSVSPMDCRPPPRRFLRSDKRPHFLC